MTTFRAVVLKGDIHKKSDGTRNIKIRITHKGKIAYVSTDLFVKQFKNGYAIGENESFINERIRDKLSEYQRKYLLMYGVDGMTVQELRKRITGNYESEQINFISFVESLDLRTTGTAEQYEALISSLKKFAGETIYASDINYMFLVDYEKHLRRHGVKNGVINYMKTFRAAFNKARDRYNDEDSGRILIPQYPFRKYNIPKRELTSNEHCLTIEQLRIFARYSPMTDRERMGQSVFMLSFFLIGINLKDLFSLTISSKTKRVNYKRGKTGREYSIKLEPEAIPIISNFTGDYANHKNFKRSVNKGLKRICEEIIKNCIDNQQTIDFPVKITSNWARHTWATIARNDCGISKDDVALCLGHKDNSNRVTDIYIRYNTKIIDEANRKVIDAVFPEGTFRLGR